MQHVHVPHPHAPVGYCRLEQVDKVLEVAHVAGTEIPSVIKGKVGICRIAPCRGCGGQIGRKVNPQPCQPAALEGGYQEGMVTGVSLQLARGDDARPCHVGVGGKQTGESIADIFAGRNCRLSVIQQVGVDMHMGPCPQLRGFGKDTGGSHTFQPEPGQGPAHHYCQILKLILLKHHEANPRPEALPGGRGRCIAPGEILIIKIYIGKVVGLKVGDHVHRLILNYGPGVYACDVAGAVQTYVLRRNVDT